MKIKSLIIIGVILLTLGSISAIYADTYHVGHSTFSLPDGYTLSERNNQTVLQNDEYVLTMYEGPILSTEQAKKNRVNMGYTLTGERNYSFENVRINQQNYNCNGINTLVYTFKKNNQTYIITLNLFETQNIPEYEDNPVTQIIDTLRSN